MTSEPSESFPRVFFLSKSATAVGSGALRAQLRVVYGLRLLLLSFARARSKHRARALAQGQQ